VADREGSRPEPDEPPPFGGSWRALYLSVCGLLLALIAAFLLFTRAFS
jgi:hypothetical protein